MKFAPAPLAIGKSAQVDSQVATSEQGVAPRSLSSLMPSFFMLSRTLVPLAVALTVGSALAEEVVTSTPVGFNKVVCLPNSDTYCSVPFNNKVVYQGELTANGVVSGESATLTVPAGAAWTDNQLQTKYFVRFLSGERSGMYYQVQSNTANQLVVDLAGDLARPIASGDKIKVCEFWTLATLFPPADQVGGVGTIIPSTNNLTPGRRTELYLPDNVSQGTNLAPTAKYYLAGTPLEWRNANGFTPSNDTILWPDTYFFIRHNHSTITSSTVFLASGEVEMGSVATGLRTSSTTSQDNFIATGRPIAIRLADLDLGSAFVSSANNLTPTRRDELLVYDNTTPVVMRAFSSKYYRVGTQWRDANGFGVADDVLIAPGTGFIIRKYSTAGGVSSIWQNNPFDVVP